MWKPLLSSLFICLVCNCTVADERVPEEAAFRLLQNVKVVDPASLNDDQWDNYLPMSRDRLLKLLWQQSQAKSRPQSVIDRVEYSARLDGQQLVDGQVSIMLGKSMSKTQINLGQTNLGTLRLFDGNVEVPLASIVDRGLVPLLESQVTQLNGQWSAVGIRRGRSVVFDLRLPECQVCSLRITTQASTQLQSPNALLRIVERIGDEIIWEVLPNNPGKLTLESQQVGDGEVEAVFLTVNTEVKLLQEEAEIKWSALLPSLLNGKTLRFEIRGAVFISDVRVSGVEVESETVFEGKDKFLKVTLPDVNSEVLTITGAFPSVSATQFEMPFLSPNAYQTADGERQKLSLRSSIIRAEVDSQVVVERLELSGLSKKDVSFSDNGTQIFELQQYSETASAAIQITPSLPLVQDEVVMLTEVVGRNIKATAYVRVSAKSGSVGEVSWDIPLNWRVTDVRELGASNSPLLYRIRESDSGKFNKVEVTLRSPLLSRSTYQNLVVQMQSVDSSLAVQQPASLTSQYYQRRNDLVLLSASEAMRLVDSWAGAPVSKAQFEELVPWLPTFPDQLDAYYRSQLKPVGNLAPGQVEVLANVDYSVQKQGRRIRETIAIRLSSERELPARFPVSMATDMVPDVGLGGADVRLIRADQAAETNWAIELSPDAQARREIEFTFTANRRMQPRIRGLVVGFDSCRQTGRVLPPRDDDDLVLSIDTNDGNSVVDSAIEYPADPFSLTIEGVDNIAGREVSGRGYLMTADGRVTGLARLLVTPGGDDDVLRLQTLCEGIRVFIHGKEVLADTANQQLKIPLPDTEAHVAVDIYFSYGAQQQAIIEFPVFSFPDYTQSVNWFVLESLGFNSVSDGLRPDVLRCSSKAAGGLIGEAHADTTHYRELVDFTGQWMLAASLCDDCLMIPQSQSVLRFPVGNVERSNRTARLCFWLMLTYLFWQVIGHLNVRRIGLVLLLVVGLEVLFSSDWAILDGCLLGSVLFLVFRGGAVLVRRVLGTWPNRFSSVRTVGILLVSLGWCETAIAQPFPQADPAAPIVAVGDKADSSILYVRRSFHDALERSLDSQTVSQIAVLKTEIDITVESSVAAVANIKVSVAVPGRTSQKMTLPIDNATLIQCRLNNEVIFPRRDRSNGTFVEIQSDAVLPPKLLAPKKETVANGPRNFGDWTLNTLQYDVRLPLQPVTSSLRLMVEFPQSPFATIAVKDPEGLIDKAGFRGRGTPPVSRPLSGKFVFPAVSNANEIELNLYLSGAKSQVVPVENSTDVVCNLQIFPDRLVSKTAYQFVPGQLQVEELFLNLPPATITSVKSESGSSVGWTEDDGGIAIPVDSESMSKQVVILTQEFGTKLGLTKTLNVKKLRTINGKSAAQFRLIVGTTDQFIVDQILASGEPLASVLVSGGTETQLLRVAEREVSVPDEIESVTVSIAERIATQIVDVFQTIVVRDDVIDWKCRCESEISGQPSFSQTVFLPPSVRVENVSATLAGTDRLQGWSRTADSVVVSLREATRGTLQFELEGSIPRVEGGATELPSINFHPDVQTLQSSIDLSSEAQGSAFIDSLGGVVPDDSLDTATPLTSSPVRLSVIDDSKPMILRKSQPQAVSVNAVAIVYDNAGQTRVAMVLQLSVEENSAPLRFRAQNTDVNFQPPAVYLDGEELAVTTEFGAVRIPAAALNSGQTCTVLLPNVVPLIRGELLTVSLPDFDAEISIVESRCFDFRSTSQSVARKVNLPSWVSSVVSNLPFSSIASAPDYAATFVAASGKIQSRLPGEQQGASAESLAADVQYVDYEHRVLVDSNGALGTTSLLVFASQLKSEFTVELPEDIVVGRVTVNGQPTQIRQNSTGLTLVVSGRVSHVEIDWVAKFRKNFGPNTFPLGLPGTQQSSGRHRVFVKQPVNRSRWWSVLGETQTVQDFQEARVASIVTGLQLLGTETSSMTDNVYLEPQSSIPPTLYQQLSVQSEEAARNLDDFFSSAEQNEWVFVMEDQSILRIYDLQLPSTFVCWTFLLGVALVVSPWLRVLRGTTMGSNSEADTVVAELSGVEELATVIDQQQGSSTAM